MVAGRDDAKAVRSILQAGEAVAAGDQHDVIQWKSVCWQGYNSFAARASKQEAEQNSRRERRDFCSRSEEHTSELQSLMRISYAVFCLKKKNTTKITYYNKTQTQQTTTLHKRN